MRNWSPVLLDDLKILVVYLHILRKQKRKGLCLRRKIHYTVREIKLRSTNGKLYKKVGSNMYNLLIIMAIVEKAFILWHDTSALRKDVEKL